MIFEWQGQTIDYELHGEGPTVALVHGLATDRQVMLAAFEPLLAGAGLRRLYLDLPGHGRSLGQPATASADAWVGALAALLRRELRPVGGALEAPLLVGYAYGGYLTQGLARELGGARGLFLLCPVVEPDFARRHQAPRRVAQAEPLSPSDDPRAGPAFDEIAVQKTRTLWEQFLTLVHPANIAADQAVLAAVRARYVLSRPFVDFFAQLGAPTTILCGRDDHWAGFEDAIWLVRQLERAQFVVLPDCGQLLPFEQPGPFAQAVKDWLARC